MPREIGQVVSRWYSLTEGLQYSSQEFYASVEKAVERRQIPKVRISRVDHREGGVLSAKREYLRVSRLEYVFDICAAPFGTGFFVSWWLVQVPDSTLQQLLAMIPLLGRLFVRAFRPLTYYQLDTALMFQESVRSAVLEALDQITEAKGLKALSELERKPVLTEFFKR